LAGAACRAATESRQAARLKGEETLLAIPFMELSVPRAEAALDTSGASFRTFYDDALPRIYGYFLHRCGGSIAVAEDLTQETFLAAVAELKRGGRVAAPLAWIFGIARHKLMDHYRRQERTSRALSLAWEADELEEELVVPDDSEAREQAIAALASVAAPQRAALVLCYVDGFSVPEAAKLLGKSVEAVESLLARGRQSFKRAYTEGSA
jgi:RNA polymerase sigma-70 factor (ECF subfamily)